MKAEEISRHSGSNQMKDFSQRKIDSQVHNPSLGMPRSQERLIPSFLTSLQNGSHNLQAGDPYILARWTQKDSCEASAHLENNSLFFFIESGPRELQGPHVTFPRKFKFRYNMEWRTIFLVKF